MALSLDEASVDWETFRKEGKQMVDFIANYYQSIGDHPVLSQVKPGYLRDVLPDTAPEHPESFDDILADVSKHIVPGVTHWQHPNFFSFFPANTSPPALLGDMMSGMFGVIAFSWVASPAATELETIVMDWLAKAIGLGDEFMSSGTGGGVIQGTASEATLVATLAARERAILARPGRNSPGEDSCSEEDAAYAARLVMYCTDQSHSSVAKAAAVAGMRPSQVCVLPTTASESDAAASHTMSSDVLRQAIAKDVDGGRVPMICIATVGSTTSCAFDDVTTIGPVCQEKNVWLHVDAAYAGAAAICPEYRHLLDGTQYADSFDFNPHKWLLTSFDCSAMWVQKREDLLNALSITPPYLRSTEYNEGLVSDYRDWQIPLGRRFRSLKLWMVLRQMGVSGLRRHIRRGCALAQRFAQLVDDSDEFEIAAPPALGLVCFRVTDASDEDNEAVLTEANASGKVFMISSQLDGSCVLRFATGGALTTEKDVLQAWDVLREALATVRSRSAREASSDHSSDNS